MPPRKLEDIFTELYDTYGPQGWWPLLNGGHAAGASQAPELSKANVYHPGDYTYPRNDQQCFEICAGAILTQNTSWDNVHRALVALHAKGALDLDGMTQLSEDELKAAIKPSGYYNMKARKLRAFADFYRALPPGDIPQRSALLDVWGVGPETADSILLYAYGQLHMVVDAYTRRFLSALGVVSDSDNYETVKRICERALPADVIVYQEFHALIVQHCKQYYSRRPYKDPVFGTQGSRTGQ